MNKVLTSNCLLKTFPKSFGPAKYSYQKYSLPKKIQKYISKNCSNQNFVACQQVHKDNVALVKPDTYYYPGADALITDDKDIILTIRHADCVPIFIFDPKHRAIALVHSGWKGTAANIVIKTVQKMQDHFKSNAKDLIIRIGPSAHKCCYKFALNWPHATLLKDTSIQKFIQKNRKYYYLDLPGIIKFQLLQHGIKQENISTSTICTICNKKYYSWTRQKKRLQKPQNNLSIFALR
jgi:YfiH family protein